MAELERVEGRTEANPATEDAATVLTADIAGEVAPADAEPAAASKPLRSRSAGRRRAKPTPATDVADPSDLAGAEAPTKPHATPPTLSASFRGSFATVRLSRPVAVAAVSIDGRTLAPGAWKMLGERTLRVECPPASFDARPHELRLIRADGADGAPADDAAPLVLPFASEYRGWIDSVDEQVLRGWVYDRLRPESALVLEIRSGDSDPIATVSDIERLDVKPTEPQLVGGGFEVVLPPRAANAMPELLTITIQESGYRPFGPILRGAWMPAAVTAASAATRALGRSGSGMLMAAALTPALARALATGTPLPPDLLPGTLRLGATRGMVRGTAPSVDIIIPVYAGEAETLACIESVLAAGTRLDHRIVVVDDCSPEKALSKALVALEQDGRVAYLRNAQNLGFVRSVNRGMAFGNEADVLLLNSDTIVPPGFLDRLYRAAYTDPAVATVTPLSNNATIFNLPTIDGAKQPWRMTTEAIDALCQSVNPGVLRDVPTAHGFCMYIKRAALDDVGLFDAETFGTGYGEENDFSLRAWLRGWRNVAATDVFVTHIGSVSFKQAREELIGPNLERLRGRYPYYPALVEDFFRTDPLHAQRNNVQKALWRQAERIAVIVTLGLGGGTVHHAEDVMARLTAEGWLVLMLARMSDGDGPPSVRLLRHGSTEMLTYPVAASAAEWQGDILDLAPRFIHVQHVIDLPDGVAEFVRDSAIPYAVTLHDFFYGCPKVTLLDAGGTYCGMPPASKCTLCVAQGPVHSDVHPSLHGYAADGERWRAKWESFLREAAQVIAPSQDTAERYSKLFPGMSVTVRAHFAPSRKQKKLGGSLPAVDEGLRVALIGSIGPQKGSAQLIELARHASRWHDDLRLVLVGHSDREDDLRRYPNVEMPGAYKPDQAQAAIARAQCKVALFLSVFPETFCYTLSEALAAGLVPVAYDFGAIGERMRALDAGVLVPLNASPEDVVAAIRRAAEMTVAVADTAIYGQYGRLLESYYVPALADLIEAAPSPDSARLLGLPRGIYDDRWCDGEVKLSLWYGRPMQRLALSFWLPADAPPQAVEILADGDVLARRFLDAGEVTRLVCTLPESGPQRLDLSVRFDFIFGLKPPDVRSCAAMLHGLAVGDGSGWQPIELPVSLLRRTS